MTMTITITITITITVTITMNIFTNIITIIIASIITIITVTSLILCRSHTWRGATIQFGSNWQASPEKPSPVLTPEAKPLAKMKPGGGGRGGGGQPGPFENDKR